MDGLVYGATAALGFAMAENFDYVGNAADFGTTWQDVAWIRAFLTAPMHAACGIFIGFSFLIDVLQELMNIAIRIIFRNCLIMFICFNVDNPKLFEL